MKQKETIDAKQIFGLSMILIINIVLCGLLIPGMYELWNRFTPPFFSFITLFCVVAFYKTVMYRLNEFIYHLFVRAEKNDANKIETLVLPNYSRCLIIISCFILYWGVFWIVCDLAKLVTVLCLNVGMEYVVSRKQSIMTKLNCLIPNKGAIIAIFIIGILLIGISYYIRCDKTFQRDSEDLVNSIIVAKNLDLKIDKAGYGLGHLYSDDFQEADSYMIASHPVLVQNGYSYMPYKSQLGLQGYVFGTLSGLFGTNALSVFQMLCCMLLACVIVAISYQISKKYGLGIALSFLAVSVVDGWVVKFSANLYWLEFSWFIPMLLSLLLLNYPQYRRLIYFCYSLTVFMRCLCGYEYISSIMFGGIAFLLVEAFLTSQEMKNNLSMIVWVGILSLLGFALAFSIHAYIYGEGNMIEGFQMIVRDVVGRRTFGSYQNYDNAYKESLTASVGDVLKKYFFKGTGKEISILTVISVISIVWGKKERLKKAILMIVTIIIPLSWFILGKAHSHAHPHMNYVLWYLGYVQVVVYCILDSLYNVRFNSERIMQQKGK